MEMVDCSGDSIGDNDSATDIKFVSLVGVSGRNLFFLLIFAKRKVQLISMILITSKRILSFSCA